MKKWLLASILVVLWGMTGNVQVSAEEELPTQGSMICENYENMNYTFEDGTLTISGKGDALREDDRYFFNNKQEIVRVVFDEDCHMSDISNMFVACINLKAVSLSSHVVDMASTFDSTGLTEIPELPEGVENISRAFSNCTGINRIDFTKLPSTIIDFSRAFQGTSITTASVSVRDKRKTGAYDYSYCFANCTKLVNVMFDGSSLNNAAYLWMEGFCDGCSSLKTFELKSVPAANIQQGIYHGVNMFRGCGKLTSVKNCGYFFESVESAFEDCVSLTTLQTRGFRGMYAGSCLKNAFKNCKVLKGTYYVAFLGTSSIYRVAKSSSDAKENVENAFKNCNSGLALYIGCKDLVTYLQKLNTKARFAYWKGGDPTGGYTSQKKTQKKTISTLKLTKYKKKTKKIVGKTVKKGKITVKVSGRTYKVTANASGKFTVKLKKVLKRKNKIKVTVSKSGYKTRSKTFKVK